MAEPPGRERWLELEGRRFHLWGWGGSGRGVVLFDSDGGKAEGQDYSWRRDVGYTLAGATITTTLPLDGKPIRALFIVA